CSKPANWTDERTGDARVKHEGSGSAEGFASSGGQAFDATGGGAPVRGERSLGKKAAATGEEGRRPGRGASAAGAGVEPAPAGKGPPPGAEAGGGAVPRLRAHAGLRVPGQGPPSGGEQGDAATVADRGRAAAGEAAESGRGARVAAAAELSRRAGAVGHLGARLAGRAGAKAVLGGDDR